MAMAAVRYLENNPVVAKMVERAQDDYRSSTRSHIAGKRSGHSPFTDLVALVGLGPEGETIADAIEARLRTGWPLAAEEWIEQQERCLDCRLRPQKSGPKTKAQKEPENAPAGLVIHERT